MTSVCSFFSYFATILVPWSRKELGFVGLYQKSLIRYVPWTEVGLKNTIAYPYLRDGHGHPFMGIYKPTVIRIPHLWDQRPYKKKLGSAKKRGHLWVQFSIRNTVSKQDSKKNQLEAPDALLTIVDGEMTDLVPLASLAVPEKPRSFPDFDTILSISASIFRRCPLGEIEPLSHCFSISFLCKPSRDSSRFANFGISPVLKLAHFSILL